MEVGAVSFHHLVSSNKLQQSEAEGPTLDQEQKVSCPPFKDLQNPEPSPTRNDQDKILIRGIVSSPPCLTPSRSYWSKWAGETGEKRPPRQTLRSMAWAHLGAMVGIFVPLYLMSALSLVEKQALTLSIGSFGASAVLVYAAPKAPLSQPRNLLIGHTSSAFIGVACYKLFGDNYWLSGTMAVSCAITVMNLTESLHPPGGATAYIASIPTPLIRNLGWRYVAVPVFSTASFMCLVALVINNYPRGRSYPLFWGFCIPSQKEDPVSAILLAVIFVTWIVLLCVEAFS
eukprot:gb/GEZN01010126.1/.p1 GENE.gb/GEZN01010126.1/~~gb/GEZN01010126.1/.p1  ORF type:complete len:287 (+),score=26.53 gb/GEZN01010126.1/:154-1014(+)